MKKVTKDMAISELLGIDENIGGILIESGMHCLGCVMASAENLEQACQVHGIDADELVGKINSYLESK